MGTWMALRRARLDDRGTADRGLFRALTISTCSFQDDVSIRSRGHGKIDWRRFGIENRMSCGLGTAVEATEEASDGFR